ncbi:MAG: hypothetical protein AAGA17_15740 [Actinomycetota bacterium]
MPRPLGPDEQIRFGHVEREVLGRVRVVTVPVLAPGTSGMSLGRWVLIRRGREHDALLAHELVHAEQWHEHRVPGFLVRYLWGYVSGLVRYRRHRLAYLAIPFEREARRRTARWIRTRRLDG